MTSTGKIIAGAVVVIVIIAAGAWWWYSTQVASMNNQAANTATSSMPSNMVGMQGMNMGTASSTPTSAAANSAAALPAGSSDSDASLQKDTAAIDAQMNGLDTDNTQVTQAQNAQ